MYEARFYTQADFDPPESEQALALYWGRGLSELAGLLRTLGLEGDGQSVPLTTWLGEARQLLGLPQGASGADLTFVQDGRVMVRTWDEIVLVGTGLVGTGDGGQSRWVVLHWFTSA